MPDDPSVRRPLGERDDDERKLPFGARRAASPPDSDRSTPARPTAPDEPSRSPTPPRDPEPPVDVDEVDRDSFESPFRPRTTQDDDSTISHRERGQTPIEDAMGISGEEEISETGDAAAPGENGASGEPHLNDEPHDVPPLIAVRSQRHKKITDSAVLKARSVQEAAAAASEGTTAPPQHAPKSQAEQGGQAALRVRVILQTIATIFLTAVIFATLFTWWTPNTFLSAESMDRLSVALATQTAPAVSFLPTLTPISGAGEPVAAQPNSVIGIVSGHKGAHPGSGLAEPGAVCEDGLTEQAAVENVANQVAGLLSGHGYTVEVLDEFDPRLAGYSATALISLHAGSCEFVDSNATGFKVASFGAATNPNADTRLVGCMISRYAETTGLPFNPSVTYDMTDYHDFREIQAGTPGAVIEIGFLYLDRSLLTEKSDVAALGIARGVLCYLRNEPINAGATAAPSPEPTRVP